MLLACKQINLTLSSSPIAGPTPLHVSSCFLPVKRGGRVVRFENVGVRYGVGPEVLSDINLLIPPGSFYFITGASGTGKSSLLKLMYLALTPSRGHVQLFDEDLSRVDRRK